MSWDAERLHALLDGLRAHRGDTTLVEVKRAAGGLPENTSETVCAFANMPDGGTILLGIDERHDFRITGVPEPAEMAAGLVAQARATVTPVPFIQTSNITVNDAVVVVAEVAPLRLTDRPAMIGGRAYLRQADGDYVMHEHELRMIEVEKILMADSKNYDSQIVPGLTVEDLVPEIVEQYLQSARIKDRRLEDHTETEILRRTGVIMATGEPTLAGLYSMGDYPQGPFPSLTVTAAVQLRTDSGEARNRDLQHFTGPIPVLLDELLTWCSRNVPLTRAYRADGHMFERPELPMTAIRELLSNALVHRDLSPNTLGTGKGVQVRLTPNSLFIQSPGGLRGVSLEQLESEDHAQAAVNQRLYSMTQKLTTPDGSPVIEGEGGGVREVFRAAKSFGLRPPTLVNTGVQFKALLWRPDSPQGTPPIENDESTTRHASVGPLEGRETAAGVSKNVPQLLQHLAAVDMASFSDLQSLTDLTPAQLRYAIKSALGAGLIEMLGSQGDRNTVYRLPEGR